MSFLTGGPPNPLADASRPRRLRYGALLLAAIVAVAGCEGESRMRPRRNADQAAAAEQDHLVLALEALKQYPEAGPEELRRRLLYHLNRWIGAQPAKDDWRRPPQIDRLPRRFREMPEVADLDTLVFGGADDEYLLENYWLYSIAQWVGQDASRGWIEVQRARAGDDAIYIEPAVDSPDYRLHLARSLFDWTVRHIQLDELLPYPAASAVQVGAGAQAPAQRVWPPEEAIPGPGWRYYPHQVLLFGHGDAWQRARVFILLARQAGLDAVMLAVDDRGPGSRANLWCPAVLIGEDLYLFDSALGLPIPGQEPGAVATLRDVLANPELLRRLDVRDDGGTLTYPVSASQLNRLAALVDAGSEALSRRMHLLESRLAGETALDLAVAPGEIAQRIRGCPGLENVDVRLWTLPYETRMYREAFRRRAKSDPEAYQRLLEEEGLYLPSMYLARHFHFLGRIAGDDEQRGAIGYYLSSRMADAAIAKIQTSEEALIQAGMAPLPPNLTPAQRQFVLEAQAQQLRLNKQHASYWIGLAQYDLGQYEAAVNWLKDRTLEAYPEGIWTAGARYNLGRSYEALGRIDDARRLYFQSESPQRHGDLVRAEMLRGG